MNRAILGGSDFGPRLQSQGDHRRDRRRAARRVDRDRDFESRRRAGTRSRARPRASRRSCSTTSAYATSRRLRSRARRGAASDATWRWSALPDSCACSARCSSTRFPNRILNIHPSLLPKYPGLHPQQQALDDGATVSGATVHFVNNDLDAGPIVLQTRCRSCPATLPTALPPAFSPSSISFTQKQLQRFSIAPEHFGRSGCSYPYR